MCIHCLPTEIIDLIVSYLDFKSATQCSAISRHFISSCRATTFRSVVLTWNHRWTFQTRCRQLFEILQRAPEIANYIRVVSIYPAKDSGAVVKNEWELPWILAGLQCVKELRLLGACHEKLSWQDLSTGFREALIHVLQLPTLTHLSLHWLRSIPVSLLEDSYALEHLTLGGTSFSHWTATPFKCRPNLRSLKVTYATYPCSYKEYTLYQLTLGNHFHFDNLRECQIEVGKFNENALYSILGQCSESLETLDIRLFDRIPINLNAFHSLQNLSIQLPSLTYGLALPDPTEPPPQVEQDAELSTLIQTLQTIDISRTRLRHFTFSVLDDLPEHGSNLNLSPRWAHLDQIMFRMRREGTLRSVGVGIMRRGGTFSPFGLRTREDVVIPRFPLCASVNMLWVLPSCL